jgi:hypothetical protein
VRFSHWSTARPPQRHTATLAAQQFHYHVMHRWV